MPVKRSLLQDVWRKNIRKELKTEIPELAAVVGTTDFNKIVEVLKQIDNGFVSEVSQEPEYIYPKMLNVNRLQWVQVLI